MKYKVITTICDLYARNDTSLKKYIIYKEFLEKKLFKEVKGEFKKVIFNSWYIAGSSSIGKRSGVDFVRG